MKYEDLKKSSVKELVEAHDAQDRYTSYGTAHYLDELRHREILKAVNVAGSGIFRSLSFIARCTGLVSMYFLKKWRHESYGAGTIEAPPEEYGESFQEDLEQGSARSIEGLLDAHEIRVRELMTRVRLIEEALRTLAEHPSISTYELGVTFKDIVESMGIDEASDVPLTLVDGMDSDVKCPKCKRRAITTDYPLRPMPKDPSNAEIVTTAFGQMYCEHCDNTYPWGYSD